MSQVDVEAAIIRQLTNQTEEGDRELLDAWISESEINRRTYLVLKEQWERVGITLIHPDAENIFQRIQQDIQEGKGKIVRDQKTRTKWWLKIAAAISFLLLVSFAFFNYDATQLLSAETSPQIIIKSNPSGQKSKIQLADGSMVSLNAGSSIEYSDDFAFKDRIIHLNGEAFFEVKRDESRPFKVVSNGIMTTALGTSFDVKAYPESNRVFVSLVTGLVQVENQTGEGQPNEWKSMLAPGEQLIYQTESQEASKGTFDPRQMVDWKEGVLYFEDTELMEVITTLERWFGVTIQLKNMPNKQWLFSGEFRNENLENILENMSYSGKIRYEITGKNIEIEFIKSNQKPMK